MTDDNLYHKLDR